MPQQSQAHAVGRVQVLSKTLLNDAAIERLVAAPSVAEVARALTEFGWGDVRTKADMEAAAAAHLKAACALVRECSPNEDVTDAFLIRYDVLNLKSLVKARALKLPAASLSLSDCGLIDPDRLARCVEDGRYAELPAELAEAMTRIEKHIAVTMDPLYVDGELDKAMFALIARRTAKVNPVVRAYFEGRADAANLMIALRAAAMKKGSAFARTLFVPGGTLSFDALATVADEPDRAYDVVRRAPLGAALAEALRHGAPASSIERIEKAADDYALSVLRAHRNDIQTVLPIAAYLVAREREAGAVRLIVTAKSANVSDAELTRRLRAVN